MDSNVITHNDNRPQATALEQLRHKYVCGYKEFFVNWDKVVCPWIPFCPC